MSAQRFYQYAMDNPTVFDKVFAWCEQGTILRVARTCPTARRAVESYTRRAFDVNKHLSCFFTDPLAFRSLQAHTGTIISGSNALQFMDRTFYPGSDLDIYCEGRYAKDVGLWLEKCAGYEFRPHSSQRETFLQAYNESTDEYIRTNELFQVWNTHPGTPYNQMRGIAAVFNFYKRQESGGPELKIQLMSCDVCTMEVIIQYHSTVVMNLITFAAAYSLFPRATFTERRALVTATAGASQDAARAKYCERGFSMVVSPSSTDRRAIDSSFRQGPRWVGDSLTWTLPLDTSGVKVPLSVSGRAMNDGLAINRWDLKYDSALNAKMGFLVLESPILKHCYLTLNPDDDTSALPAILKSMQKKHRPRFQADNDVYFDSEVAELCKHNYSYREHCGDVGRLITKQARMATPPPGQSNDDMLVD